MSRCSVVTVSYHTGAVLFACIKSALRQAELAEMVIVDNGNPPDVASRLQQWALSEPRLKIISGHGNAGFAKGCNFGMRQTTGEYMLLLNPDCLLPPDALANLMDALQKTQATLAGCWLQNPDGSEQRGGRRQLLTPVTALSEALGLHRLFGTRRLNENDTPMPPDTHEVPAISGACMCIKKTDYTRLFGMDEGFFLHVEDLDFCMRVHKSGGKVICVPKVKVAHMLSTSGEVSSRFLEWQKAKGFMRYFRKHFQGRYFPGVLLLANLCILARYALKVSLMTLRRSRADPHMQAASKRLLALASGLADLPDNKALQDKTILVTGATGQVGLCVMRRLIASGASVLALSRGEEMPFYHEQLRWLKGDLAGGGLELQDYLVDAVLHCAPLWHLPQNIALFADAEAKRIIAFGSTSLFGKALSRNGYEKDVVAKLARAEMQVAEQCAAKDIHWTILRPTLIYGIGLDANVTTLANFIRRFGFFPVYPPALGKRQPVHADDLALAALQALDTPASYGKAYNVSGGEIVTYRQMLERIFTVCQRPLRIIDTTLLPFALDAAGWLLRKKHVNGEIARRMNDDLVFFHDEAKADFGYAPRAFLSGDMKDIEG